jgi:hypothetical protein
MSRIASATFVANVNSVLVFGRELTAEEITALANYKVTILGQGHQVSPNVFDSSNNSLQNYWDNLAAAEGYANVASGFTPPPTSVDISAV